MSFKSARKASGMTVRQVAERIGVSSAAVTYWETQKSRPTADRLLELAKLYGVSMEELMKEDDSE